MSLNWISNDDLYGAVLSVYETVKTALTATTLKNLKSNIIDPFSLVMETGLLKIPLEQWIKNETQRQTQKTMQNAIGDFHQTILGTVDGWEDLGLAHPTGLDIRKEDDSIYAEIKNKYNTLNSSSAKTTADKLINVANQLPNSKCYVVHIIGSSQAPYNRQWLKNGEPRHERVYQISGESFYELVTGSKTALFDLYRALPEVIESVIEREGKLELHESSAMDDLKNAIDKSEITDHDYFEYFLKSAYKNWDDLDSE